MLAEEKEAAGTLELMQSNLEVELKELEEVKAECADKEELEKTENEINSAQERFT